MGFYLLQRHAINATLLKAWLEAWLDAWLEAWLEAWIVPLIGQMNVR